MPDEADLERQAASINVGASSVGYPRINFPALTTPGLSPTLLPCASFPWEVWASRTAT